MGPGPGRTRAILMSGSSGAGAPPNGLQLDLLSAVLRMRQIGDLYRDGQQHGALAVLLLDRLVTCDIPRLERHLTADTREWWAVELGAGIEIVIQAKGNPEGHAENRHDADR